MHSQPVNARRAQLRNQDAALFRLANPNLVSYLEQKAAVAPFSFAGKMLVAIGQYGGLTPNQKAAVERMMAQDAERASNPQASRQAAVDFDASKIQAAFDRAITAAANDGEGIKWLGLRAEGFKFYPAGPNSTNPGAIYVKDNGQYIGKVTEGKFRPTRECTLDQTSRIAIVARDPMAAALAYGLRTKSCSICGRELTNPESRARGIGPICARRMGF